MGHIFASSDEGYDTASMQMPCGYMIWVRDEGLKHIYRECGVEFQDHDEVALGHEFVETEREERDY